jgi:hypothetical protein
MTEDFILEEGENEGSANRRPFLYAVAALAAIGILAIACTAIFYFSDGAARGRSDEIAMIETQNAIVAVTNEAVTRTIEAMETEAARPTNTPRPTATDLPTLIPTNTPRPTDTPVVKQAEEGTETPDFSGTSAFVTGTGGNTPTPIAPLGGGTTGNGSLPQTGIETWGAYVAALLLIGVLVVARRLRSS